MNTARRMPVSSPSMAPHDPGTSACSRSTTSAGSEDTTPSSRYPGPLRVGSPHRIRTKIEPRRPLDVARPNNVTVSPTRSDHGSQ